VKNKLKMELQKHHLNMSCVDFEGLKNTRLGRD